ncbi:hypothetical protein IC611_07955 [Proteus mirabilis]
MFLFILLRLIIINGALYAKPEVILSANRVIKKIKEEIKPDISSNYILPISLNDLLLSSHRQKLLKSLWDSSSLSKDVYINFYQTPLEQCTF